MSSLDSDTSVSRSAALSASCQARTVAISEVLMTRSFAKFPLLKGYRPQERSGQPGVVHS